jgi:hypothetical protein
MSAIDHLKAALERSKLEDVPQDAIAGNYERNGPERDRDGQQPEYPSRPTEPSKNGPSQLKSSQMPG